MNHRRWYLWVGLALLTMILNVLAPDSASSDTDIAQTVVRPAPAAPIRSSAPPESASGGVTPITSRAAMNEPSDLFGGAASPRPAPKPLPPPAVTVAPPAPLPVLPLRFIGRMIQKGQPVLFVMWGERNLAVREGDVLDATYRLDRIRETQAEFTYLPQGQKLTLALGGGSQ